MECPVCGENVGSNYKFCPNCGQKLTVYCMNCGTKHHAEAFYCKKCGSELHQDHSEALKELGGYSDEGQLHLWHDSIKRTMNTILPYQGWKIHISSLYSESKRICEAVLPVLIKKNIPHKVLPNTKTIKELRDRNSVNKYKLIVIYPPIDEDRQHICLAEHDTPNNQEIKHMFIEKPSGKKSVQVKGQQFSEKAFNRISLNNNVENAREIINLIRETLEEKQVNLFGAPQIHEDQTDERPVTRNGNAMRIKYRYDSIGPNGRATKNSKWATNRKIRSSKEFEQFKRETYKPSGILGLDGETIKNYREKDVKPMEHISGSGVDPLF